MGEECDFETLSAMIESDGEFETPAELLNKDVKSTDDLDSSDDDIAEDDLDKLAGLVELDTHQDHVQQDNKSTHAADESSITPVENKKLDEGKSLVCEKVISSQSAEQKSGKSKEALISSKQNGETDDESETEDLASQLKMMQEQMKLLESKLKKKNKPKEGVKQQSTDVKVKQLREINIFEEGNDENQQPWDRKKTKPHGTSSCVSPKVTSKKAEDKSLNAKLQNTVSNLKDKHTNVPSLPKSENNSGVKLDKELFGDDSGSDWEDMDGEKNSILSKPGQEIKKIIQKSTPQSRVAHDPGYDQEKLMNKKHSSWQKTRPSFYNSNTEKSFSDKRKTVAVSEDTNFVSDPFSGIRIINPLISSLEMKSRMAGRRLIKMSHLYKKVNTSETDSDWVTVGVLVSKSEPKMSSKGTQYSIWKLSDLEDCDKLVTLMLFGGVHKDLWKTTLASVVGLLNPAFLKNTEKYQHKDGQEVTLTLDNAQKVMLMGVSKDFGTCTSKTKAGRSCNNVINKSKGDFCTYHVQAAYKKVSAKRSELQAGFSGVTPKSFEKKLFGKNSGATTVYYGGQSFTTGNTVQAGKRKQDQISLKELQHHTQKKSSKITTLQVQNLASKPQNDLPEKEQIKAEKNKAFHNLLTTPTVGSVNFVRYLSDKDNIQPLEQKKKAVVSVSARDFLNNSQKEIKKKINANKTNAKNNASEKFSAKEALKKIPCLGRGLAEQEIEFDMDAPPLRPDLGKMSKQQFLARKKAAAKVSAAGGIKKGDPNAVKTLRSPETQARLKRRLEEVEVNEEQESVPTPSKKRSRLLGDLDIDDPNVRKMLEAKSAHSAALTEEEQEKQDQYFEVLEKKEAMEDKMRSITKVKCKVVTCKKCKYSAFSASQLCKDEGHPITVHDGIKRFFKCKTCHYRTVSIDKLPKHACKNCGSSNFEKTTMLKEKKGPKLPGEELLLRGEETKFLNSMQ